MKKYKVIFLGTPDFAVPSLQRLIDDKRFDILAVVTEPDRPAGRGKMLTPPPVKVLAKKYHLTILQPHHISHIANYLSQLKLDTAVVVAYGQIIPKEILDIPKFGFVNIHPSLLPKYRGPTPMQTAIINGDQKTGITLMKIDQKMDHGDIMAHYTLPIVNHDYQELSNDLANLGANLITEKLLGYLQGRIKAKSQNHQQATFTKLLKKSDGEINWSQSAKIIERKIRAYHPWPGTYTFINNKSTNNTNNKKRLKILKAHLANDKIIFGIVQLEGKTPTSWREFKHGYKHPLDFCGKVVV